MIGAANPDDDSSKSQSGIIPGSSGLPAFTLSGPEPAPLPVLIAVPHAGRTYPACLIGQMRNPSLAALKLEDRYADLLGAAVARETGVALLVAHAPRAMIDLNRAETDMDWEMLANGRPPLSGLTAPSQRVRGGLGLIPRRLPRLGELWRQNLEETELAERIAAVHRPYHACLAARLAALRRVWGAALLIDLHSMPPLHQGGGRDSAEFVLGDRFGVSCHDALLDSAFGFFAWRCRGAAYNRPYAGGYALDRHARPLAGIHALQLEIDRSSYLDSRLIEPGNGFSEMVTLLVDLVRRLASDVAELGRGANRSGRVQAAE